MSAPKGQGSVSVCTEVSGVTGQYYGGSYSVGPGGGGSCRGRAGGASGGGPVGGVGHG